MAIVLLEHARSISAAVSNQPQSPAYFQVFLWSPSRVHERDKTFERDSLGCNIMPKETRYLPQMKLLVTVLVVFSFQTTANARKFTRCEFAKELAKYGVPRNLVPDCKCS